MSIDKAKYWVRIDGAFKQFHLETDLTQVVGLTTALGGKSDTGHKHNASDIDAGSFEVDRIPNLNADKITAGSFHVDRIPNIPASKTTSGSFHVDRIPNLPASKTTSGTFNADRIPNLDASKINSGTLEVARIPDLNANKITEGELGLARIPDLPASRITSGTIDIDRLPAAALERLIVVANQAARFALTTTEVQKGDTVQQEDTGIMYRVIDDTQLSVEAGYKSYTAGAAATVPWSGVQDKPDDFPPEAHTHTPAEVGLGNVANLSRASQVEAEAGTEHDAYMTPLRTMQAMQENAPSIVDVGGNYAKGVIDARSENDTNVWTGTQEQYDALPSVDADTVYFIVDASGPQTVLDAHINNTENPHQVTKSQVGLSNLENYGLATKEEAEAGTLNTKYMTPIRVAQAIAEMAPPEDLSTYDAHISATNNPHSVTKDQVNLGNVTNHLQATKTEFDAHTGATNNPHSVTKGQVGLGDVTNDKQATETAFNAHTAATNNPHSVTKAQVSLGNVTNHSQVRRDEMGAANGVATLDGNAKVLLAQLPDTAKQQTYVVADDDAVPTTGLIQGDKVYLLDSGDTKIWDGSAWQVAAKADWENVNIDYANLTGTVPTWNQNTTGSAASLTTSRNINGTAFNGTSNITTAHWGTARTITIGSTGKSVNGSANVSWTLAEIGAAATSHTHTIANVTGLQTALDLKATVFVGTSTPSGAINGDVWIDTSA